VVLLYATRPEHCPVLAVGDWLAASNISTGPVFRPVHRNGVTVRPNAMTEAAINRAVQRACTRALGATILYSAQSLRRRVRQLRGVATRLRPGDRSSNTAPLAGQPRRIHQSRERLDDKPPPSSTCDSGLVQTPPRPR
jgi:hypothetical protein